MKKLRTSWLGILPIVICASSSLAQDGPWNGTYRITGGVYRECCGIAGPFTFGLPNSGQTYVRLTVERDKAHMAFLKADMQTVSHLGYITGFSLSFSNGVVVGGERYIWFGDPWIPPWPGFPTDGYIVYYEGNTLRINGAGTAPCPGCSDIPTDFTHSNVTAVLSGPVIDNIVSVSNALRFHFAGEPFYRYTVEFADSLSSDTWQTLGTHSAYFRNIDVLVTNSFTNAETRFFRVRKEP